jgi:ferredoxin
MSYSVEIDHSKCVGCGSCYILAPEIFDFNKDESVSFVKKDIDPVNLDILLKCARSCPASAIVVKDSMGNILSGD